MPRSHLQSEPPLGTHRNASAPMVARVDIIWTTLHGLARVYRSLRDAEAAIAHAAQAPRSSPPPDRDQVLFRVVWTDGFAYDGGVFLRPGAAPSAILREHLRAVALQQRDVYGHSKKLTDEQRAQRRVWGVDMLARLEADASGAARNLHMVSEDHLFPIGTTADDVTVSLLPDPLAAVAELEAHFAAIRPPVKVWMGHGRTVPRTTNRDVMYAANWISLALAHDMARLRALTGRSHGTIWDRWSKTIEHVRRHLGPELDAGYRDNPKFWSDQVAHIAHKVDAALRGSTMRNAAEPERATWKIRYRGPRGGEYETHHVAPDKLTAVQAAAFSLGYQPDVVSVHRLDGAHWRAE